MVCAALAAVAHDNVAYVTTNAKTDISTQAAAAYAQIRIRSVSSGHDGPRACA